MFPFDAAPEFIQLDNRIFRSYSPVSGNQMHKKHAVLFPEKVVRGKSVLDLGCGLGATGHWCLSLGAKSYAGIEAQELYATTARELLDKYHPEKSTITCSSVEKWLEDSRDTSDIVSLMGVLHGFVDYYSVLKKAAACAQETVVIEELYPDIREHDTFCGVQFSENARTNLADEHASLIGRGTYISPEGLAFVMRQFGFEPEAKILPPPINKRGVTERYGIRFTRCGHGKSDLSSDLQSGRTGNRRAWNT